MDLLSNPKLLQPLLYLYLALAITLLATVLHFKRRAKKWGDFRAVLFYFLSFFALLFVLPILIIVLISAAPARFLAAVGGTMGRGGRGLLFIIIALPISIFSAWIGSRDPVLGQFYPFSKQACSGIKKFILYETAYLFFYYLPWEFVFRGLLFFPLVASSGLWAALAVQTLISTLYHLGHPDLEIFGALGSGLVFGLLAYSTGSFLYTAVIHAMVGISNDIFLYKRYYHRKGS